MSNCAFLLRHSLHCLSTFNKFTENKLTLLSEVDAFKPELIIKDMGLKFNFSQFFFIFYC